MSISTVNSQAEDALKSPVIVKNGGFGSLQHRNDPKPGKPLGHNRRRLREQNAEGATCHSSQFPVGAAGENDRNLGADHNSGCQCSGQILKFLKEDISSFQIGNQQ
jgi:hypothetical protein